MLASNPLIQVTPGLMIWTIVCFLITFFVLKKVAFGRIQADDRRSRRERIQSAIDEADRAREPRPAASSRSTGKLIGQAKSRVGGDPQRGTARRRRAARARPRGDRGGPPAPARGDPPSDRAGDPAGARPDPRRGRQAQPRRGREDHPQVAHRRRPAAPDRRGARRDRLLRARREPVVAVAHRIYARALFEAAQERGHARRACTREVQQLRDGRRLRTTSSARCSRTPRSRRASRRTSCRASRRAPTRRSCNFLRLLAEKGRAGELPQIADELDTLVAAEQRILDVELTTATELSDAGLRAGSSAASRTPPAARCRPRARSTQI